MKNNKRLTLTALLLVSLFANAGVARQPAAGVDRSSKHPLNSRGRYW